MEPPSPKMVRRIPIMSITTLVRNEFQRGNVEKRSRPTDRKIKPRMSNPKISSGGVAPRALRGG